MSSLDLKRFIETLKEENLKVTPQRIEIFKEVCGTDAHREAEDIYWALRERNIDVSRATVYRTMDLLCRHDFVQRMDIGDGKWRYEHWLDCSHHDHLICIRCGKIIEFSVDRIEDIQQQICDEFHYKLVRHIHQLFGICSTCQTLGS